MLPFAQRNATSCDAAPRPRNAWPTPQPYITALSHSPVSPSVRRQASAIMTHSTAATVLLLAALPYALAAPQIIPFLSPLAPDVPPIPLPTPVDAPTVTVVGTIVSDALESAVASITEALNDVAESLPTPLLPDSLDEFLPGLPTIDFDLDAVLDDVLDLLEPEVIDIGEAPLPGVVAPNATLPLNVTLEDVLDDVLDLEVIDLPPPNTTLPLNATEELSGPLSPPYNDTGVAPSTLPAFDTPALPDSEAPEDPLPSTLPAFDTPALPDSEAPEDLPFFPPLIMPFPEFPDLDTPETDTVPLSTFTTVANSLLSVIHALLGALPGAAAPEIFVDPILPPDGLWDPLVDPVPAGLDTPVLPRAAAAKVVRRQLALPEVPAVLADDVPAPPLDTGVVFGLVAAILEGLNELVGFVPGISPVGIPAVPAVPEVPEVSVLPSVLPIIELPAFTTDLSFELPSILPAFDVPALPDAEAPEVPEVSILPAFDTPALSDAEAPSVPSELPSILPAPAVPAPLPTSLDALGDFDFPEIEGIDWAAFESPPFSDLPSTDDLPLPEPVIPDDVLNVPVPDLDDDGVPVDAVVPVVSDVAVPAVTVPDVSVPEVTAPVVPDVVVPAVSVSDVTDVPLILVDAGANSTTNAANTIDGVDATDDSPFAPVKAAPETAASAVAEPPAVDVSSVAAVVPAVIVPSVAAPALPTSLDAFGDFDLPDVLDWPFSDLPATLEPEADGVLPDLQDLSESLTAVDAVAPVPTDVLAVPVPEDVDAPAAVSILPAVVPTDVLDAVVPSVEDVAAPDVAILPAALPTDVLDVPVPDDFEDLQTPTVAAVPTLDTVADIPEDILNIPWPDLDENGVPVDLPVAPSAVVAAPAALPTDLSFLDIPVPDDFVDELPAPTVDAVVPSVVADVVPDVTEDAAIPDEVFNVPVPDLPTDLPAPALAEDAFGAGFPVETDLPLVLPTGDLLPVEGAAGLTEAVTPVATDAISGLPTAVVSDVPAVPTVAVVLPFQNPVAPVVASVAPVVAPVAPVVAAPVPVVATPPRTPALPFQVPTGRRPLENRQVLGQLSSSVPDAKEATYTLVKSVVRLLSSLLTKLGIEDQVPDLQTILDAIPANSAATVVPAVIPAVPVVPDLGKVVDAIASLLPVPTLPDVLDVLPEPLVLPDITTILPALAAPEVSDLPTLPFVPPVFPNIEDVVDALPDLTDILPAPEVSILPAVAVLPTALPTAEDLPVIAEPEDIPAAQSAVVSLPAAAVDAALPVVDDLPTPQSAIEELPAAAVDAALPVAEDILVADPTAEDVPATLPVLAATPPVRRSRLARRAAIAAQQAAANDWESFLGELDESYQSELAGLIHDTASALSSGSVAAQRTTLKHDFDALTPATKAQLATAFLARRQALPPVIPPPVPGVKSVGPNLDDAAKVDLTHILGHAGSLDPFGQARPHRATGRPADVDAVRPSLPFRPSIASAPAPASNPELDALLAAGGLDPHGMRGASVPAGAWDPYRDPAEWGPTQPLEGLTETLEASRGNHIGGRGRGLAADAGVPAEWSQTPTPTATEWERNLMVWFHRFVKPSWNKDVDAEIDFTR
ncbi:hypothetical protein C7974DRAFT_470795 [Boeremia exigua]|uniref:uncharacterized protein n=1 Tax=Boeremia exigua TaxID=749465 RepID=UPI001E8CEBC3|nr:uncharacterized protein C7974DRAFT_470795 [Boeremia exigua]KAH6637986.1 hypothetical protein C7974DRAFT_470795 [Boeremia exigua]